MYNLPQNFLDKIEDYSSIDICWLWKASKFYTGYGQFKHKGKNWLAHRFSYWKKNGNITPGMQMDHLCRNKACVNPHHLEEVDNSTNTLRGMHRGTITHCKRGHEFTPENTYIRKTPNGSVWRRCKICTRIGNTDWRN